MRLPLQQIRTLSLFLLGITVGSLPQVLAQNQAELIPFIGYEVGTPHSIQREPGVINQAQFPTEGFGFSINHTVLFGIELLIPEAFSNRYGLSLIGNLAQADGRFVADPYTSLNTAIDLRTGLRVATQNSFTVRATETQARIALLGSWRPWKQSTITFGPWLGYRFSSNVTQTEEILSPDNTVFIDGEERKRAISAGEEITSFNWRFGALGKASYNIPLADMFNLSPFITLQFDYESLVDKSLGFRAFSLGGGIGFSIDLFSNDSNQTLPANLPPTALPDFALSAEVDLYIDLLSNAAPNATNSDQLTIAAESTLQTQYLPLLPFVHVDRNVPEELQWLTPEQTTTFGEQDLVGKSFYEVQRHRLNLIAKRMQLYPEHELTLTPVHSSSIADGTAITATQYADSLRNYLVDVWGVDADRIHLREKVEESSARAANVVRIQSTSPVISGPLIQAWREEQFLPPHIGLRKNITALAGLQRWEMTIHQGDSIISQISNDKELSKLVIVPFNDSLNQTALEVRLTAFDYVGNSTTATDRLLLDYATNVTREHLRSSWTFLDPAIDPELGSMNKAFMELIAAKVTSGAKIRVEAQQPAEIQSSRFTKEGVVQELLTAIALKGVSPEEIVVVNQPQSSSPGTVGRQNFNRIVITVEMMREE